jgi:hypothetical protein
MHDGVSCMMACHAWRVMHGVSCMACQRELKMLHPAAPTPYTHRYSSVWLTVVPSLSPAHTADPVIVAGGGGGGYWCRALSSDNAPLRTEVVVCVEGVASCARSCDGAKPGLPPMNPTFILWGFIRKGRSQGDPTACDHAHPLPSSDRDVSTAHCVMRSPYLLRLACSPHQYVPPVQP